MIHKIEPIGIIRSPFTHIEDMPIQPKGAYGIKGSVQVHDDFIEGLSDLDGFSHIYLFYMFHQAKRTELTVTPFMDTQKRGVFATRSPLRPNHIGMSIVHLKGITGDTLTIEGVDVLDGTPLLDIKPYIEKFDQVSNSSSGWMKAGSDEVSQKRSDNRFV